MIQALINITVTEGENSTLACHVGGIPLPSVSWTEVRTGDRTQGNIRSLINVSRSDAGEYKCEASNFCGNDSKSTFVIVNCKWLLFIVIKSTCIRVQRKLFLQLAILASPDIISTSPKSYLMSRIDFTVLLMLFEFLKRHHLPVRQDKNRVH